MGRDIEDFIQDFGELVRTAQRAQPHSARGRELLDTLTEHLGKAPSDVSEVVEDVPVHRLVDADIILESMTANGRCVGIGGGDNRRHMSLADMVQQSEMHPNFPLGPPDYVNLPVGPDEQRQVIGFGLRLFMYDDVPVALLQRKAEPRSGRESASLEILCSERDAVTGFLAEFRKRMQSESVIKGQIVSLSRGEYGPMSAGVTFHARPDLDRGDVVLPDGVLDRVSEHALGIANQRSALLAAQQHLKRGILLYGPPGTGKTHTVRYLLGASAGTTAILLSGQTLGAVSEAAQMARAFQPSIVVLEDCDLIAEDRSFGHGPQPLLFEVLDAMDGLDGDADVTFVLTTNRVDMLERALAQRPGRVDLAVEIPLPQQRERAALLRLYAGDLPFSRDAIDAVSERTSGTTASLGRELIRRAVLRSALDAAPASDEHLLAAADELMDDGAALTRSLLGSGTADVDDAPAGPEPGMPGPAARMGWTSLPGGG
ncbi:AAA family ATPase [Zhihengliuella salsuginis]|uniref:ATPase n=1 Tax=Zhihengliuella salsuginis TaxID=578222 RepID=A0ABQ3GLK6_9MICC|nr:ATP-binding protein [Zhihengliuella salsuginis]GHD13289.1 ATPase [Zhihengliuella salsuginis]